jgi:hypothetical protein
MLCHPSRLVISFVLPARDGLHGPCYHPRIVAPSPNYPLWLNSFRLVSWLHVTISFLARSQQKPMQALVIAPIAARTSDRVLEKEQLFEIHQTKSGPAYPERRTLATFHRYHSSCDHQLNGLANSAKRLNTLNRLRCAGGTQGCSIFG